MRSDHKHAMKGAYGARGFEMAVDFVTMYLVMYTMIATLDPSSSNSTMST